MLMYLISCYSFLGLASLLGLFNRSYDGNFIQRIALGLLVIWSVWRIYLMWHRGWSYPHEPMIATALWVYALGTWIKTQKYCNKERDILRRRGLNVVGVRKGAWITTRSFFLHPIKSIIEFTRTHK